MMTNEDREDGTRNDSALMLTYADVCWQMEAEHMLTHIKSHMPTCTSACCVTRGLRTHTLDLLLDLPLDLLAARTDSHQATHQELYQLLLCHSLTTTAGYTARLECLQHA
jgi:hypothetical protein